VPNDDRAPTPAPSERDTEALSTVPETPERIGPYRILQKLGEGGMGEVYEAEQTEPLHRVVALKLIKWGMDTKRVVARFESERQALALMDHPGIARVFVAGATETGRPYFVMEFVKGVPITAYCDTQRLTTGERLELFMQVCDAVQHAHHKGVIHRDIKPSNVLISLQDAKPVPKIIDFGVAKATAQKLTERTVFTEFGALIGTPEYMSPEQAELTGLEVDTRTDVYSLGVLLYELLVGALPFEPRDLRRAGFDEIRRKIQQDEPPRPSTRISTLGDDAATESARRRRTDLSSLRRQLKGDLDWIVMRALEKDRTRRYQSPAEFKADVLRHLSLQPVVAGPPGTAYRLGKFVRRHRLGVAACALLVLALAAGLVGTTVGIVRARRAEAKARQEAQTSDRVSEFLTDLLATVDPERLGNALMSDLRERVREAHAARGDPATKVEASLAALNDSMSGVNATDAALRLLDQEILARAAKTIENELAGEPVIAARLEQSLSETYANLGLYDPATMHARRALEIRERELGREHPDTLDAINNLALRCTEGGATDEAEPLFLEAMRSRRRLLGEDDPATLDSMNNLAWLYWNERRFDEAEPIFVDTLARKRRVLGKDDPETLRTLNNLAMLYSDQGRLAEAEPLLVDALESRKRVLGVDAPDTLSSVNNLATCYFHQSRLDQAELLFRETLASRKRVLGSDHPDTLSSINNLAYVFYRQGRLEEAARLHSEALEIRRRVLGNEHPETLRSLANLSLVYREQGRHGEAESLLLEILEARKRALGVNNPDTVRILYELARVAALQGERKEALDWLRQAVEHGLPDPQKAVEDRDFASLQGDPAFELIVARPATSVADPLRGTSRSSRR
jgi:non-specific serine/threonine protein kinase/serine/threonine-protein kinase